MLPQPGRFALQTRSHLCIPFFMALNIEFFRPIIDFKNQMDEMIALLKRSPLAVGRDEILVAGEKEFLYEKFNHVHGVPLVKPIVDD